MRIILGVFGNTFQKLRQDYNCQAYGNWYDTPSVDTNFNEDNYVVKIVNGVAQIAEEIFFDITQIDFKITEMSFERSITISELFLIVTTPEYLNKTIFFREGIMVDKQEILDWFLFDPFWKQFE